MENRHGLVVETCVTQATGTAARDAALTMVAAIPGRHQVTLGADQNYDTRDCVRELRELRAPPQVAQQTSSRARAIAGRTPRHPGDAIRQRNRTQGEASFGGRNTVGLLRKTRHRGVGRVGWRFTFAAAVYNLVRRRTWAAVA
jgi:hypothetical protein